VTGRQEFVGMFILDFNSLQCGLALA